MISMLVIGALVAGVRPRFAAWLLLGLSISYPQYLLTPAAIAGQAELVHETSAFNPVQLQPGLALGLAGVMLLRASGPALRMWLLIATFAACYAFSGVAHGNELRFVVMETLPLVSYCMVVVVPCLLVRNEQDLRRLVRGILLLSALACAGAVTEFLLGIGVADRYYEQARSAKGLIASFVLIVLVYVGYNRPILRSWLRLSKRTWVSLGALAGVTAVLTINRFMIFLYVALALAALLRLVAAGKIRPSLVFIVVGSAGVVLALSALFPINPLLLGKVHDVKFSLDVHRSYEYSLPDRMVQDVFDVLIGRGSGTPWYKPWARLDDFGNHNFYIQLVWKFGVVGVGLFVALAIRWWRDVRRTRARTSAPELRAVLQCSTILMGSLVAMGVTQNRFMSPKHTALTGVLLGIPYAVARLRSSHVIPAEAAAVER